MKFLQIFTIGILSLPLWGAEKSSPTMLDADEKYAGMLKVQSSIQTELEKANKEQDSDIHKINCLMRKKGTVDGLVKASSRVKKNMKEADFKKDQSTVEMYSKKIKTYSDSVNDIKDSLTECVAAKNSEDTEIPTAFIGPDRNEQFTDYVDPWDPEGSLKGGEGYPVIPPASPFR